MITSWDTSTRRRVRYPESAVRRAVSERYRAVVAQWEKTTEDVTEALQSSLEELNPMDLMLSSTSLATVKPWERMVRSTIRPSSFLPQVMLIS